MEGTLCAQNERLDSAILYQVEIILTCPIENGSILIEILVGHLQFIAQILLRTLEQRFISI